MTMGSRVSADVGGDHRLSSDSSDQFGHDTPSACADLGGAVGVRRAGSPHRGTGHPPGVRAARRVVHRGVAAANAVHLPGRCRRPGPRRPGDPAPRPAHRWGNPPVLPELRAAVDTGTVGPEQTRIVVSTMRGLPARVDPDLRDAVRASLVQHAQITEPVVFARFARQIAERCDPDGTLDDRDPIDKVELTLGSRNPATGLTGFKGFLDDIGVETMTKAIDGLAAPRPARRWPW